MWFTLQDNVGTWQKCVQAVEQAISKGLPVVVDNTNMDLESRTRYIKIAKVWDIPVKCFIMETSMEHAQHNERVRLFIYLIFLYKFGVSGISVFQSKGEFTDQQSAPFYFIDVKHGH